MKKTLLLLKAGFESSCFTTPEFMTFFKTFKKEFKHELEKIGAKKIEFSRGHFHISGFFTSKSGQIYYFNTPEVRYDGMQPLLYRTTESYKDYTGGTNQWAIFEDGMIEKMNIK